MKSKTDKLECRLEKEGVAGEDQRQTRVMSRSSAQPAVITAWTLRLNILCERAFKLFVSTKSSLPPQKRQASQLCEKQEVSCQLEKPRNR